MNSENKIFTRSKLAEVISRDPSKKADFSMAWEASKNPELAKKTAAPNKRSSDKDLGKVTEITLVLQEISPESAASTIELTSGNLPSITNNKPTSDNTKTNTPVYTRYRPVANFVQP